MMVSPFDFDFVGKRGKRKCVQGAAHSFAETIGENQAAAHG
jgi:hypothetical protein